MKRKSEPVKKALQQSVKVNNCIYSARSLFGFLLFRPYRLPFRWRVWWTVESRNPFCFVEGTHLTIRLADVTHWDPFSIKRESLFFVVVVVMETVFFGSFFIQAV